MKKIVCLLGLSIAIYSSVEIYYYARLKHLLFEVQRLDRECNTAQQKIENDVVQDYATIYAFAMQNLGMQKIKQSQIKKLY